VLAAVTVLPFAGGVPARAEAAAVEWTPYSGTDQATDDGCGYPMAVAETFSGRVGVRAGTGPAAGYFICLLGDQRPLGSLRMAGGGG
jgi:hypothetical protein